MKNLLITILLVIVTNGIFAQDIRLRSYSSAFIMADNSAEFKDINKQEFSTNILIDVNSNYIEVFAKKQIKYSIISRNSMKIPSNMYLLDDDKVICIGSIKQVDSIYQLTIKYSNVMFIYNCKKE